jgi:hypothetical protein
MLELIKDRNHNSYQNRSYVLVNTFNSVRELKDLCQGHIHPSCLWDSDWLGFPSNLPSSEYWKYFENESWKTAHSELMKALPLWEDKFVFPSIKRKKKWKQEGFSVSRDKLYAGDPKFWRGYSKTNVTLKEGLKGDIRILVNMSMAGSYKASYGFWLGLTATLLSQALTNSGRRVRVEIFSHGINTHVAPNITHVNRLCVKDFDEDLDEVKACTYLSLGYERLMNFACIDKQNKNGDFEAILKKEGVKLRKEIGLGAPWGNFNDSNQEEAFKSMGISTSEIEEESIIVIEKVFSKQIMEHFLGELAKIENWEGEDDE